VYVHVSGPFDWTQQLNAPGAIDEVEEDELAKVAPGEHPSRETPLLLRLLAGLERLRLFPDRRDLDAVGEAFCGHGR
jgi:hypothetical protein